MRKVMEQIPAIKSVMTPFPYQVDAGASLEEAAAMMREHEVRHLPVNESGTLVGVLDRDELERGIAAGRADTVRAIEVGQAVCFELSEPLDRVLSRMAEEHIECVVVVKRDKVAGIFTTTDACTRFVEFLHAIFPPRGDGAAA